MKKVFAAAGIAGLALMGAGAPASADPEGKIRICHATGSESNPYVEITISANGLAGHNAQGVHDGDIVPAPSGGCPAGPGGGTGGGTEPDAKKVTFCHATGSATNPYEVITTAEQAWLHGHKDGHNGHADLYPVPAEGCPAADDHEGENPGGGGGDTTVPPKVVPPAVVPPAVVPPAGGGEETTVTPAVAAPVVVRPGAGAAGMPAGAGAAVEVNRGFNAQTAVAGGPDAGIPGWAGGLAVLLSAASIVAMRRRARGQDAGATL